MYVTVCGRLNHLTDDVSNEGGVGGKGIKGNALCRLNAVQMGGYNSAPSQFIKLMHI